MSESEKVAYWNKWNKIAIKQEKLLAVCWNNLLDDIEKDVNKNVKNNKSFMFTKELSKLAQHDLFDVKYFKKHLADYFGETVSNIIYDNINEALIDIGVDLADIETEFQKKVVDAMLKNMEPLMKSVDTLFDEIGGIPSKVDPDNPLKTLLHDKFEQLRTTRSDLVCSTAATLQRGTAQRIAWEKFKVKYMWLSRRDSQVRDSHRAMDGVIVDDKGYFNVGGDIMKCPGGGSSVKENAGCRCGLIPEMDD